MNRYLLVFIFMMRAALAQDGGLDYPSVWQCNEHKPNWYCDQLQQEQNQNPPATETPIPSYPMQTAEQLRTELKQREDLAVMYPTESNIKNYIELWKLVQEKGAAFADNWRRVVWQNPELDYSLKRPANNTAIKLYDALRGMNEQSYLKSLAKEHGLIFFYRSDCPYCHAMAPTIKMMNEQFGMDVLAVSVDGAALLPEFPQFTDGRLKAQSWGVERVPALFIGSKTTGDHAAIGFGQMALSEIVNRIAVLTNSRPGEDF